MPGGQGGSALADDSRASSPASCGPSEPASLASCPCGGEGALASASAAAIDAPIAASPAPAPSRAPSSCLRAHALVHAPANATSTTNSAATAACRIAARSAFAALDRVRANLLVQVGALDAEHHRRARDVPAGHAQRVHDVLALGLLAVLTQRQMFAAGERRRHRARRVLRLVVCGNGIRDVLRVVLAGVLGEG